MSKLNNRKDHSEIIGKFDYNLTKHVARVHTTSRMIAPLRQLLEAGCRTSEEKDRTNQTRFGMVSEILSTKGSKGK